MKKNVNKFVALAMVLLSVGVSQTFAKPKQAPVPAKTVAQAPAPVVVEGVIGLVGKTAAPLVTLTTEDGTVYAVRAAMVDIAQLKPVQEKGLEEEEFVNPEIDGLILSKKTLIANAGKKAALKGFVDKDNNLLFLQVPKFDRYADAK